MNPPRVLAPLNTEWGTRVLWWAIGGILVLALAVFVAVGANGPDDPELADGAGGTDTAPADVQFGRIAFTVTRAGAGPAASTGFCALHAQTPEQRQRGMMFRRDLGGLDAMVFTYERETAVVFHNSDVPIPLSVAWFDGRGAFLESSDLEVCASGACPQITPRRPIQYAVEVPRGGLARLGVGPGSRISVGGSC